MNFTWISHAIDLLTTQYSALFLAEANTWLKWIGIIVLTVYAIKWTLVSVSGQGGYDLPGVMQFFVMFSIASFMLSYYARPLPWGGSTLAGVIPDTADKFAAMLNDKVTSLAVGKFMDIVNQIESPPSMLVNSGAFIVWLETVSIMYLCEAVMLVVNILGFLAVGVLTLMGPLTIPFFLVPKLSWIFWDWVQALLEFSFWRVISTAIVFVWATAWSSFWDFSLHGNYTLAHFTELMPYMIAMTLGMIVSLVYLTPKLTGDLFKGTATAGANWVTAAAVAIRAAA